MPPAPAPPSGEAVLALDVGTSSVRCLAYSPEGQAWPGVHAVREQDVHATLDGGTEMDPERVLRDMLACLGETAAALLAKGGRPAAVACCTIWHSLMGVDEAGRPLTPLFIWSDTRSGPAAQALQRKLDTEAVHRRTGCVLHSSYWPAKLCWLRERDPALFGRIARFVSIGEYLEHRLFGRWRVNLCMASGTGLLNQHQRDWDKEVLEAAGIEPARLSPIAATQEPVTGIVATLAGQLVPLRRVPFFSALGDGACSNVGCGATGAGEGALMIGTSAALRVLFREDAPRPAPAEAPPGLWRYLLDERRALIGGATSNGGSLLAWLRHNLRLDEPDAFEARLAHAEPGAHGLIVLPFLAGERNPDYPLDATGWFAGIRTATTAFDIAQACLEAAAYRVAAIADRLRAAEPGLAAFIATGGLLHSPAWMQMLADVLGMPLETTDVPEASSRGAALMAWEALGRIRSALDCPPERGRAFLPDPARHARHTEPRARHEALYRQVVLHLE